MIAVAPPRDFWVSVRQLADAYRQQGLTPDERAVNILGQLKELPLITQRGLRTDLAHVAVHIPDLFPLVATAVDDSEADPSCQQSATG
jgi:hypothetical protein